MDFSEPSAVIQSNRAIDEHLERGVQPHGCEHDRFLGEDYERHVVDDDHYEVTDVS